MYKAQANRHQLSSSIVWTIFTLIRPRFSDRPPHLGWHICIDLGLFFLVAAAVSTAMLFSDVLKLAQYDDYDYCKCKETVLVQ